jgi:hypothetical protein
MSVQGFTKRQISVTFAYGTGADGSGTPQEVKIPALRMTARINIAGGASMGELNLRIYGLDLGLINRLSTLGVPMALVRRNSVIVEAGDDQNGMAQVFQGTISQAWADFNLAPDVAFEVIANTGLYEAMAPVPPFSAKGDVDAAQIMSQLAQKMNLRFENSGVTGVKLNNPNLPGSYRQQAEKVANSGRFNWIIENGILAIWPFNNSRTGNTKVISKDTGMIGYPSYTSQGIVVKTLFTPNLRFGSKVQVISTAVPLARGQSTSPIGTQVLPVDGVWAVTTLNHDIAAEYPGGMWETEMQLTIPGYITVPRG